MFWLCVCVTTEKSKPCLSDASSLDSYEWLVSCRPKPAFMTFAAHRNSVCALHDLFDWLFITCKIIHNQHKPDKMISQPIIALALCVQKKY